MNFKRALIAWLGAGLLAFPVATASLFLPHWATLMLGAVAVGAYGAVTFKWVFPAWVERSRHPLRALCVLGLHRWWSVDDEAARPGPDGLRTCLHCGRQDEGAYDGISPFWRRIR